LEDFIWRDLEDNFFSVDRVNTAIGAFCTIGIKLSVCRDELSLSVSDISSRN